MTDLELDTIALLSGLEDLNLGYGVALGTPRPSDLGPADGEAECRIAGRDAHHRFRPGEAEDAREAASISI